MADRTPADELEPELLDRYLAGECTDDEVARVRRWLKTHPEAARRLDAFLDRVGAEGGRESPPSVAASWRSLRARMRASDLPARSEPAAASTREEWAAPSTARQRLPWRWAVATAAACIVLVAGVSYVASRVEPPPELASSRRVYTAAGERLSLRLADGTRVQLAPGSVLRAASDFGDERREVFLEGEGYFEVAPDEKRRFTVFAASASVHALAAAFGVRAYSRDSAVTVAVRSGAAALSGTGRLQAGDVGRVTDRGEASVRHGVPVDSLLGWAALDEPR